MHRYRSQEIAPITVNEFHLHEKVFLNSQLLLWKLVTSAEK